MESQAEGPSGSLKMLKRRWFWRLIVILVAVSLIAAGIPSLISWDNTASLLAKRSPQLNATKLLQAAPLPAGTLLFFVGFALLILGFVGFLVIGPWTGHKSEEAAARMRLRRAEQQLAQQLGAAAQLKITLNRPILPSAAVLTPGEAPSRAEKLGAVEQSDAEQLGFAEREVPMGQRLGAVVEPPFDTESELAQVAQDRLTLPALWEVTHSRLDLYHRIATAQARRSFVTAQLAIGAGFALLVAFAILATQTRTTADAITTASLGAVSAALAGYISRTFVRSQESAAAHLRAYFDQPLEFSKYLAAERLLASNAELEGDKHAAILTALVQAIVTPSPSPNGSATKSRNTNSR